MQCLSCRNEVQQSNAKLVLQIYLCPGCAAMAEKAVSELERESARALVLAKDVLAQHIMRGGLMLPKQDPSSPISEKKDST